MGVRHCLGLIGLTLLCQGCGLAINVTRNLVVDPAHFDRFTDHFARKIRDNRLADDAWEQASSIGGPYSRHYARGFKEGFVDYLSEGGHPSYSDVPLLPPRRYWRFYYQSPEGNEAIQDWFAGWRHGVAMAKQSGYRNFVVLPTTLPAEDSARKDGTPPKPPITSEGKPETKPESKPETKPAPPPEEKPKPEEVPQRPKITEPPGEAPPRPKLVDPPPASSPPKPDAPKPDAPKPPAEDPGTLLLSETRPL